MFCVIQKVQNKRQNMYGEYKELAVTETKFSLPNVQNGVIYGYSFTGGRFERPVLDAYKISIHHSYREGRKVKKKQWSICTMSHYDLVFYSPYDFINSTKLQQQLNEMELTEEELFDMIYAKLDPIMKEIRAAYEQTEEYKTSQQHQAIVRTHLEAKAKFDKEYGQGEYCHCYDVFGELRNPEYLEQLQAKKTANDDYARRSKEQEQKRFDDYYNYSSGGSSYRAASSSNYSEEEQALLKEIYRLASKKFHPDISKDDGSKMKLLTGLKEKWGL